MKVKSSSIGKQLISISALVAVFWAANTQASLSDGIVDQWTVDVSGAFVCSSAQFDGQGGSCNSSSMNWGKSTGYGQSGLDITNSPNTIVDTDGAAVANMAITHRNQTITGTSLDKVTLRSTLTLSPFSPTGTGLPSASLDFLIDFYETPNSANPCADGGAHGTGVNISGCGDIFVVDQNTLNFPFMYDLGEGHGEKEYFISFFEETNGLNPLSDAACTAAGAATGCLGFITQEGKDNTFNFAAKITTDRVVVGTPVPVPGTLPALGLGLLLLAIRRRSFS